MQAYLLDRVREFRGNRAAGAFCRGLLDRRSVLPALYISREGNLPQILRAQKGGDFLLAADGLLEDGLGGELDQARELTHEECLDAGIPCPRTVGGSCGKSAVFYDLQLSAARGACQLGCVDL